MVLIIRKIFIIFKNYSLLRIGSYFLLRQHFNRTIWDLADVAPIS